MTEVFADKVIELWVITYGFDTDQTYLFTDRAKLKAALHSHLSYTTSNEQVVNEATEYVYTTVTNCDIMPVYVDGNGFIVRRLILDRHNPIHMLLCECYKALEFKQANDDLPGAIDKLFVDQTSSS